MRTDFFGFGFLQVLALKFSVDGRKEAEACSHMMGELLDTR